MVRKVEDRIASEALLRDCDRLAAEVERLREQYEAKTECAGLWTAAELTKHQLEYALAAVCPKEDA